MKDSLKSTQPGDMETPQQTQSGTSRGRILFADDDEGFQLGLGLRLQKAGFECDFAKSGSEAIELLRTKEYDVLLSDIHMPGNAGLELIESLPATIDGLPIILLTGRPTVETASRSVRLRVAAYLTKPPDFEELCGLLRASMSEYRSVRLLSGNRRRIQDWDRELERMQKLLQQAPASNRQATMQSYLRLTLRNLVAGMIELESLLIHDGDRTGADEALEKQELLNALRKTVAVLHKTREHFKSKELGELRAELEALLR